MEKSVVQGFHEGRGGGGGCVSDQVAASAVINDTHPPECVSTSMTPQR